MKGKLSEEEKAIRRKESSRNWKLNNLEYVRNKGIENSAIRYNRLHPGKEERINLRDTHKLQQSLLKLLSKRLKSITHKVLKTYYKKVDRTRICLHCGKEFIGTARAKWCKQSHSSPAREAKRLRKRIMQGRHKPRPKWQDTKSLFEFYRNCPPGMVVDHIIPLNHPLVSGMHCVSNLQYLSWNDNSKKSNKFDGTSNNEEWRFIKI